MGLGFRLPDKHELQYLDKLQRYIYKLCQQLIACVCSPTVRIIAFQAIDPGSTPGRRTFLVVITSLFRLVLLQWESQHFNRVTRALNTEFMEIFFRQF